MTDEEEQIAEAKRLYEKGRLGANEISNLTGLPYTRLYAELGKFFKTGELTPRKPNLALKPKTPKGQGKGAYVPTGVPRGRKPKPKPPKEKRQGNHTTHPEKFTDEQKAEIVRDYYERGLTWGELQAKWGIHSAQMQRLRNLYGANYAPKSKAPKHRRTKNANRNRSETKVVDRA